MDKIAWNRIKHLRQERKLSVEQLALLSGLSKSSISKIERGNTMPTHLTMLLISRSFDLPMHQVFNPDYKILTNYKKRSL